MSAVTMQDILVGPALGTGWEDMTVECIYITPAIAEEMLSHNTHNRDADPATYNAYTRDSKSGNWRFAPAPIMFDVDGVLADGSHRLNMVIRSNTPQWFMVVRNVPKDVQEVIDTNRLRSNASTLILSAREEKQKASDTQSLIRSLILWNEGHGPHHTWRPNVNASRKVTKSEIIDEFDRQVLFGGVIATGPEPKDARIPLDDVNVMKAIQMAQEQWKVKYVAPPVLAFAYMRLAVVDRTAAEEFLTALTTEPVFAEREDDPILQLQTRLRLGRARGEGLRLGQYLYLIITAWNAWRTGTGVRFINVVNAVDEKGQPAGAAFDPLIGKIKGTNKPDFPKVPLPV